MAMDTILDKTYNTLWLAVQSCPALKPVDEAKGFVEVSDGPDFQFERRRQGKTCWAELLPAPGGFLHPATAGAATLQTTYVLRWCLGTYEPRAYYASKEAIYRTLIGLGADLGVPGVTAWRIIDATDEPIQSQPKDTHLGWEGMLKIVVDAQL